MTIKDTIAARSLSGIGHNLPPEPINPPEPIDPTDLAEGPEAAGTLKVKEGTLATWRSQGKGPPYVKSGRTVRYPRAGLRNYLAAGLTTPQPAAARQLARGNMAAGSARFSVSTDQS